MLPTTYPVEAACETHDPFAQHTLNDILAKRLDAFIAENSKDPIPGVFFPCDWVEMFVRGDAKFDCVSYGKPDSYRLALGKTEMYFRVIGAIEDFNLPPYDKHRMQTSKMKYIQQILSLGSLHADRCIKDIAAVQDILDAFTREIPYPVDHTWTAVTDRSIRFSNRLLVPADENKRQTVCPMPFAVDPTGSLRAKADLQGLVHTDDNVVEYLRLVDGKYVQTTPAAIRRGDLAEIRFSIGLFTTAKSTLLAKLILRAIIVLDVQFSRSAQKTASISTEDTPMLKRKRVADDHDSGRVYIIKVPRACSTDSDTGGSSVSTVLQPVDGNSSARTPLHQDIEMTDDARY